MSERAQAHIIQGIQNVCKIRFSGKNIPVQKTIEDLAAFPHHAGRGMPESKKVVGER